MELLLRSENNANAMSRIPEDELAPDGYVAGATTESLSCGRYCYCIKVHIQWRWFTEDLDDALPLSRNCIPTDNCHIKT